jgi:hypothetical protein
MKQNKILLSVMMFILVSTFTFAVECGSIPTDGCIVSANTTFTKNTYYLNGSTSGAISFRLANGTLDCNGSTFVGNYTSNPESDLRGLVISGVANYSNSIIKNCIFQNYQTVLYSTAGHSNIVLNNISVLNGRWGFRILGTGLKNLVINNSLFDTTNESSVLIDLTTYSNTNITIQNTNFNNSLRFGIEEVDGGNNYIFNNTFSTNNNIGAIKLSANDTRVNRNLFIGSAIRNSNDIRLFSNNNIISNNSFSYTQYGIYFLGTNPSNIIIINNTFYNGDQGSFIRNANNISFINNSVSNMTQNYDSYNVGLKIFNSTNILVEGNNFSDIATVGVLSQGSYNISIKNNSFYFIPLLLRDNYLANDGYEPRCAVQSTKFYKGFFPSYGNYNLTLTNNFFDTNTPCYVQLENQTIFNNDLTNYWYRSFNVLNNVNSLREFYVPNNQENLSNFQSSPNYIFRVGGSNIGNGCSLGTCLYLTYLESKNYSLYKNINLTNSFQINIYNLTNNIVLFDNGTTTYITGTNKNYNMTLASNQYVYIYKNISAVVFNLFNLYNSTNITNFNLTITNLNDNSSMYYPSALATGAILFFNNTNYSVLIQSPGFFNQSATLSFTSNSTYQFNTSQSEIIFNAKETITNNPIYANFTIGGVVKNNGSIFYLNAGSYNVTINSTGYSTTTTLINVSALDQITYNITLPYNQLINFTLFPFNITPYYNINYTLTVPGYNYSKSYITTNLFQTFQTIRGLNYTFFLSGENISNQTFSFTSNSLATQNFSLVLYTNNINLTTCLYDESSLLPVNNSELDIYGEYFSGNFTTGATSNCITIGAVPSGIYEYRYYKAVNSSDYRPRSYWALVPSYGYTNLSLYQIATNNSQLFQRTFVDSGANPIDGYLEVQRAYVNTTGNGGIVYRDVEVARMDSRGVAVFSGTPNTQQYRFRVLNSTFDILQQLAPDYLIDASSEIQIATDAPLLGTINKASRISGHVYYQNSTKFFVYDYNGIGSNASNFCLNIHYQEGIYGIDTSTCSNQVSGTIAIPIDDNLNGSFNAVGYATVNGIDIAIDAADNNFKSQRTAQIFGSLGLVLLLMCVILFSTISRFTSPVVSIIGVLFSIFIFGISFLGLTIISNTILGGLFVIGLIVLYITNN